MREKECGDWWYRQQKLERWSKLWEWLKKKKIVGTDQRSTYFTDPLEIYFPSFGPLSFHFFLSLIFFNLEMLYKI